MIKHTIDTGDARPVKKKQWKCPQAVQGVMDDTIADLKQQKLIEPSTSPWCSPVMIVKQTTRDGKTKYRFISDNRGLNDVTIKDSFTVFCTINIVQNTVVAPHFWALVKLGELEAERRRDDDVFVTGMFDDEADGEQEQVEVSQLENEEGLVLGAESEEDNEVEQGQVGVANGDESELETVGGGVVVAQITVEPALEVDEVVADVVLVQCRWTVEGARCTKMCKPAGMGTHVAVHRKAGLVEPEEDEEGLGGAENQAGGWFNALASLMN